MTMVDAENAAPVAPTDLLGRIKYFFPMLKLSEIRAIYWGASRGGTILDREAQRGDNSPAILLDWLNEAACGRVENDWVICSERGTFHRRDDTYLTHDDEYICSAEYNANWSTCAYSDEIVRLPDLVNVINCGDVASWHVSDIAGVYTCAHCDSFFQDEEEEEALYCSRRCWEAADTGSVRLASYDTNILEEIDPVFFQTAADGDRPIFYGVELEVVPKGDRADALEACAEAFNSGDDFAIFKRDGSLPENGFEIVTLPATLSAHRKHWAGFFDGANSASRQLQSWNTGGACGLHVHVDIVALTALQLGRFMMFYNAPLNSAFISAIAGRAINNMSRYCASDPNCTVRHGMLVFGGLARLRMMREMHKPNIGNPSSHYAATSISRHNKGKTIEVRIFRGNVAEAGFWKNLEFVDASVQFAKSTSLSKTTPEDFLAWFSSPSIHGQYKHLHRWLAEHGWLDCTHKFIDVAKIRAQA